ncbi:MAG: NifU family protein [Fimbriiglobus sp.]|jgi:Fe-S cluster biogenesis protein NfuA|nr:NifU family protein [Fimbriiglobus sp.]
MNELHSRVAEAMRCHAAPAMDLNPAEVEVVAVEGGIASVRLAGACASCPATIPMLITGLENELRKHVPEVDIVEAVP